MIEEKAQVIKSNNEFAWVHTQRETACGQCRAQKGCGTNVFSKVLGNKFVELKVLNPIHAEPGDEVILGLRESVLIKSALIMYMLPLLAMFLFASLTDFFAGQLGLEFSQGWIIVSALCGLAFGFVVVRYFAKNRSTNINYQPVILRRVSLAEQTVGLMEKA